MIVYETTIKTVGKGFTLLLKGAKLPRDFYVIKTRYKLVFGSRRKMNIIIRKNRKLFMLHLKEKNINLELLDSSRCTESVIFGGNYFSIIELSRIESVVVDDPEYIEFLKLRYLYEFPKS